MNRILVYTLFSMLLSACGSDDESSKSNISSPSLSEVSGVWDLTSGSEDDLDIRYLVIKDHGEFIFYSLEMGEHEQDGECYRKHIESITDLGDGVFEVSEEEGTEYVMYNMSIVNSQITIEGSTYTWTFPKSTYLESDFTPFCNSLYEINVSAENKLLQAFE